MIHSLSCTFVLEWDAMLFVTFMKKNANCTHEHVNESFHFQVPCTFVLELDAMLFVMLIAHMNMSCEWIVITLLNSDSNSLFQDYRQFYKLRSFSRRYILKPRNRTIGIRDQIWHRSRTRTCRTSSSREQCMIDGHRSSGQNGQRRQPIAEHCTK